MQYRTIWHQHTGCAGRWQAFTASWGNSMRNNSIYTSERGLQRDAGRAASLASNVHAMLEVSKITPSSGISMCQWRSMYHQCNNVLHRRQMRQSSRGWTGSSSWRSCSWRLVIRGAGRRPLQQLQNAFWSTASLQQVVHTPLGMQSQQCFLPAAHCKQEWGHLH